MATVGRPRLYNPEEIETIKTEFINYIGETDIPIIAEFSYKHNVPRETLYKYEEFSTLLKDCITKKEAALEAKALRGDVNVTMAIFSLKQLGWSDKMQTELTGKDGGAIHIDASLNEKINLLAELTKSDENNSG